MADRLTVETFASGALIFVALIAFNAYRRGELGDWARAKFFNQEPGAAGVEALPQSATARILDAGAAGALTQAHGTTSGPGGLAWPVSGTLTSGFGPRGGRHHDGIDLAVATGTPVRAARAGRVIAAGSSGGYGLKVDLDHGGGLVTRYAHLSRIDVRYGTDVTGGATIGLSGNTGESTGPHLHFEVRRNGAAHNPTGYLAAGLAGAVSA
ncbi:MAG: M23 family metallopeptidase [Acidimicrobiia bacterium]